MLSETDEELLKDLRIDYAEPYKAASPYQCMETYEQERRLAANLIDRLDAEIERLNSIVRVLRSGAVDNPPQSGQPKVNLRNL